MDLRGAQRPCPELTDAHKHTATSHLVQPESWLSLYNHVRQEEDYLY